MLVSISKGSERLDESLVLAREGFCFISDNKTERVITSIITLSDYPFLGMIGKRSPRLAATNKCDS